MALPGGARREWGGKEEKNMPNCKKRTALPLGLGYEPRIVAEAK